VLVAKFTEGAWIAALAGLWLVRHYRLTARCCEFGCALAHESPQRSSYARKREWVDREPRQDWRGFLQASIAPSPRRARMEPVRILQL
jgi:hypothetical protein